MNELSDWNGMLYTQSEREPLNDTLKEDFGSFFYFLHCLKDVFNVEELSSESREPLRSVDVN